MARVVLIRHTAVSPHWKGRCYGRTDVGLSAEGRSTARSLAGRLIADRPDIIVSSPLRRARILAARIAQGAGLPLVIEPRLMECDFGAWEGRHWEDIWLESGDAMMGMVSAPASFRPGGNGETTYEVRDRALAWLGEQRADITVLAVCHGGPIAAIRGTRDSVPAASWPRLVPGYGEMFAIDT
ncbi:MAG: histidine phosphatase family protein [Hyphomicrobium sp.]|nr:histidine phosphatase family protein [Hyphomicrobium sp.]